MECSLRIEGTSSGPESTFEFDYLPGFDGDLGTRRRQSWYDGEAILIEQRRRRSRTTAFYSPVPVCKDTTISRNQRTVRERALSDFGCRDADTLSLGPAGRGQASQRHPDAEDHRRGSKSGLAGEDGT